MLLYIFTLATVLGATWVQHKLGQHYHIHIFFLLPVTYSIGVATFNTTPENLDQLIEKADALMYTVKQVSKNAVRQEVY